MSRKNIGIKETQPEHPYCTSWTKTTCDGEKYVIEYNPVAEYLVIQYIGVTGDIMADEFFDGSNFDELKHLIKNPKELFNTLENYVIL